MVNEIVNEIANEIVNTVLIYAVSLQSINLVLCIFYYYFQKIHILKGCSYGGGLVQLGELARLSEISPSLRNSYNNIMCSYEK